MGFKYSAEEIASKVATVPYWGHSIQLPFGIVTPGKVMRNLDTIKCLQLPQQLTGKSVLDIGAWDGYYSFECEKRGACVLAIDNLNRLKKDDEICFQSQGNRGFEVAKEILGSKVEFREMDVYQIDKDLIGRFDIVLFLGVLYHLKHPLLALEKIAQVVEKEIYIETEFIRTPFINRPIVEYLEHCYLNEDPTNHCRPNASWLKKSLFDLGFSSFEVLYKTPVSILNIYRMITNRTIFCPGRIIIRASKK